MVAVAATTPIELPEEILAELNRPLDELRAEQQPSENRASSGAPGPALSKPLELPLEMLEQAVENVNNPGGRGKRPDSGRTGRALLIAGGVFVLLLTAFLTSPAWLSRTPTISPEARAARDEALALLRRDDAASKEEALSRLRALSAANPQNVELLAEVGVALAMHLDDIQVRVVTLRARVERLKSELSRLRTAQTPANWQSLANTMSEELAAQERILTPLEERGTVLSKDAVQVLKQLVAAPEKEAREHALARLRARALMTGVMGGGDASTMAVQLAQAELRDWSSLTMAEYVLNTATPSEKNVEQAFEALGRMREADNTFLRVYVLEARIALLRKDPATARTLLDTVITLNPKHELAQQLHVYAEELEQQAAEPKTTPVPESPEAPAPESPEAPATETPPAPEATPTAGLETPPAPTPETSPSP
jgi:tetratricopeptide (TPR) repeat protein